jgi:multidrug efflux pump subunit AcrA (membrane-fusion protein)
MPVQLRTAPQAYVYVIKPDGTVETRLVTVGQSRNNRVLIQTGLVALSGR